MKLHWKSAALLLLCGLLLTGCGREKASAPTLPREDLPEPAVTFYSDDGTAEYVLAPEPQSEVYAIAGVQAKLHFLTGADARKIAHALFGEADFHEQEPQMGGKYSRRELEQAIGTLEPLMIREAMEACFGSNSKLLNLLPEMTRQLDALKALLPAGSKDNPHTPCLWEMQDWKRYSNRPDEKYPEGKVLMAHGMAGDYPYAITVKTCDQGSFQSEAVCELRDELLDPVLSSALWRSQLCRREPTAAEVADAVGIARKALEGFGLGTWTVEEARVIREDVGDFQLSSIWIRCVPVYEGIPGVSGFAMGADPEKPLAYGPADCTFRFAPEGQLLQMVLTNPADAGKRLDAQEVLLKDQLCELGMDQLRTCGVQREFGVPGGYVRIQSQKRQEPIVSKTRIHQAGYRLGYQEMTDGSAAYVPVMAFRGHTEYYGKNSGKFCFDSTFGGYEKSLLTVLDAVTGKVIG